MPTSHNGYLCSIYGFQNLWFKKIESEGDTHFDETTDNKEIVVDTFTIFAFQRSEHGLA